MHLLNMHALYRQYLSEQLQPSVWPLNARPLLVPVRCTVSNHALLENNQGLLTQFGIQFDFVAVTSLVIRTLPRCLPMLNIEQFFMTIQQSDRLNPTTLIQYAIDCQSFDMYNANPSEAEGLVAYCLEQGAFSKRIRACYLPLEPDICKKIMQFNDE